MAAAANTDDFSASDLAQLRKLARGLAGDDADDLVHDAWLSARADHRSPGWWRTVLRRRRAMHARSTHRRKAREAAADGPGDPQLDPGALAERAQLLEALDDALSKLDPMERALILRRYVEDRTAAELSAEFDVPPSTVRTKLSRSLARMRKHLDRTYGGRSAWMAGLAPWSSPLAVMSTTTKVLTSLALGSLVVAAIAWTQRDTPRPAAESDPAPAAASKAPANSAQTVRDDASPSASTKAARQAWQQRREAIRTAQRGKAEPADPASVLADENPEDIVEKIRGEMARATQLNPIFADVAEQGVPLFVDCLQFLPETASGKLHLRAQLIGEPAVGGLVETVEVVDDSLEQPDFEECLRESTYAIELGDLQTTLDDALNITLDMDDRSLSFGTTMNADDLAALHAQSPELLQELVTDPDARASFAALANDPGLAEQHPELATAIRSALEL